MPSSGSSSTSCSRKARHGRIGLPGPLVVCGWNSTARELITELSTDEYIHQIVVIHDTDKNPAGDGVYFVNGDITTSAT